MAAANYFEIVQNLYIAYYQRPADPAGLKYWPDQIEAKGGVASSIVNAFATSPESIALYGPINATNIGDVVDKIYLALFNRVPDAAGKQFYVDGFTAGTFTAGTIALDVLNGATNGDNTAIQNKVQVANAFTAQIDGRDLTDPAFGTGTSFSATYSGDADAQAARNILKAVTSDPTTVLSPVQVTEQIKTKIADTGDKILTSTGLTFKVTENPTTHAVSFDGTATGDITIAWAGAVGRTVATFTRAGLTGTASFPKATSIALSATDVLSTSAANIAALPISGATGTVKLTDTSLAAASLNTLNAAIAGALNASTVTTTTGSAADLATLVAAKTAGTITLAVNFAATVTGTVSVAGANAIDAANGTGVITATLIEGTVAALKTLTGADNAYTLTVSDTTAAAADLIALDAMTTVAVGASKVTTITGLVADIKTVAAAAGITKAANWSAVPTDVSISVADANTLDAANGTGVITATITAGAATTLKTLTGTNNIYTLTVTDTTAAAADLLALDALTTVAVGTGAVTTITGSVADIKTVAAAAGITKAANWSAVPTDVSISVADANALDAATSTGFITATITEGDVTTLKTLTGTNNAYKLTITDATAVAADLIALDARTTVAVGASKVTTITGSVADIKTVAAAAGITKAANWSAVPTDVSVSVADANTLDAANGTGVITATITAGAATTLKTLTGTNNAYTLTVTDTTAAAADLLALDALTTVAVGAGAVTTITGSVAHIKTVAAAAGITKAANWSAAPTDVSVSVADANILNAANGDGVITATITAGTVATLKTLTGADNAYKLTITDATAASADLIALDERTTVAVDAGAVTTITGSVAHIKTVAAAAGITKAANWSTAPMDVSISVADANTLDAANGTGVITETITEGDVATLKTLTGTNNAYTLTVTDTTAAAADLLALDALTTGVVGAGKVATITGSVAEIKAVAAAAGITKAAKWSAAPTDASVSIADANILDAANGTGVITATITEGDVTTLKTLTGTNNAYTLTVTDTTAAAADLIALDARTTVAVDADAVTTITGSVANIKTVAAAAGITKAANWSAAPTDTLVSVADANILNAANGDGVITATITAGTVATLMALTGTGNAYTLTVTNTTAAAADLLALDALTTGVVRAGAVTTITGSAADLAALDAAKIAGTIALAVLSGSALADTLAGDTGADTFKYTATSEFGDTIMDFGTGDTLHLSGVASFGGFFTQTGITAGSDYSTSNVFIFSGGGAAIDITTVATEIANNASVNATAGLIILREDTSNEVEVWFCADMKNNGAKQMIATLVGVDITTTAFNLA